ncbi:hypothetical protein [Spirosoma aerophilum]
MRTFLLNGTAFDEGDTLTITAPELGTVEVSTTLQPFSNGKVVGLQLNWLTKPTGCLSTARLSLYSNGQSYHTMQLAYHCSCGYNVHPRSLLWFDLQFSSRFIEVEAARKDDRDIPFVNLPRAAEPVVKPLHTVELEQTATVAPMPVAKPKPILPEPEVNVGRHGQFQLF